MVFPIRNLHNICVLNSFLIKTLVKIVAATLRRLFRTGEPSIGVVSLLWSHREPIVVPLHGNVLAKFVAHPSQSAS